MTFRRIAYAAAGFAAGLFTAPFAAIVWPFAAAWFFFNEAEEED